MNKSVIGGSVNEVTVQIKIQIQATSLWECTTECEAGWSLLFGGQEEHGGRGAMEVVEEE